MQTIGYIKIGLGGMLAVAGVTGVLFGVVSCGGVTGGTAPTPFLIQGSGTIGNVPPSLTFLEPVVDITRGQGDAFLIRWNDTDPDNNAKISFSLTVGNTVIPLVGGIDEDEALGPNLFRVPTTFVAPGTYSLRAVIADGVNQPVTLTATLGGALGARAIEITVVPPGEGPQTIPPQIAVIEPTFNRSVTQDDELVITIRPTEADPADTLPYDPDSDVTVVIALDRDRDPEPDVFNPDIVLEETTFGAGSFQQSTFEIAINVAEIPPLPGGASYFIRATVTDETNPPVHSYAVGAISVVSLVAGGETGRLDMFDIGRTKSGARLQGFNPAANLGSTMNSVGDFDGDGVDDLVVVAQFGNPQNVGPVGEAYLIYGLDRARFGGTISINTVGDTISGATFHAPPVRTFFINTPSPRTMGITDINIVPDLNGDGRPELLFGLPHVHGAYDSTDYDPGDNIDPLDDNISQFGCYPDFLVNNMNTQTPQRDGGTLGFSPSNFYAGGMAVLVTSTNRDNDGPVDPLRLSSTSVSLELTGQFPALLDSTGVSRVGAISVRADNALDGTDRGTGARIDPEENGRISGARFIAGGFDAVELFFGFVNPNIGRRLNQPPREGLFGMNVASIGDLNSDSIPEIIISAPRNERYMQDLLVEYGILAFFDDLITSFSTNYNSTRYRGSIAVLPGRNYNQQDERDIADDTGTSRIPQLDHFRARPEAACGQNPASRVTFIPAEGFEIFAEEIDDWLGGASSAGDFNQDGIGDILCGAPRNDRNTTVLDTGTVYVIYGRSPFGTISLSTADDPVLRPPMLRVRGVTMSDQIGWKQTSALDVNNDRIDDVLFSSPHADFGGVKRVTCEGSSLDLTLSEFDRCVASVGDQVFHGPTDTCRDFDYDNDGVIDDADRCVFCCLSSDCTPEPECVLGQGLNCCDGLVDNGFVGIIFGGVQTDGDRSINQLATSQLPGVRFFGASAGDLAGFDISSAGDFNQDGFGDIVIVAPGVSVVDTAARERRGVVYLIFGGTHLATNGSGGKPGEWNLKDVGVEGSQLPGIVFMSPYVVGRPNEAAPKSVAFIGDVNNDGFGDISIGIPQADFIDPNFPQGPDALGTDAAIGRRSNVGEAYIIYGNNFGSNRVSP